MLIDFFSIVNELAEDNYQEHFNFLNKQQNQVLVGEERLCPGKKAEECVNKLRMQIFKMQYGKTLVYSRHFRDQNRDDKIKGLVETLLQSETLLFQNPKCIIM